MSARSVFVIAAALFLAATAAPDAHAAPVTVSGVVFHDLNANGRHDSREKGMPGVMVSDGERVSTTSADGTFALSFDADEDRFVFVTQPTGYRCSTPFFVRIDPAERPSRYDAQFGLADNPRSRSPSFSFLVTSDSQFRTQEEADLLREEFEQITRTSYLNPALGLPAFFFSVGDLTMSGTLEELRMYRWAASAFTMPCYHIFGGHDGNSTRSVDNYSAMLGPPYYSWDYGGRHFVVFVTEVHYFSEAARARQDRWLDADVAMQPPEREIILACHIPPANDRVDLWSQGHTIRALFYAHYHEVGICEYKGIPYIDTAPIRGHDWGAFTRRYRIVRFDGPRMTTEQRGTGQYKRLEVPWPPRAGTVRGDSIPVIVCAYDTTTWVTDVTAIVTRQGGGPTEELTLRPVGDWTWRAEWPAGERRPGTYALTATATSNLGESWTTETAFEVAAGTPPQPSPGSDWPQFLGSLDRSRIAETTLEPPLTLAWTAPTGGANIMYPSPVLLDSRVFIAVQNDEAFWPGVGVAAFEAATGKRLWKADTDSSVRFGVAAADGGVFALSSMGKLYCFDADEGETLWTYDLYPTPPGSTHRFVESAVTLWQDKVLVLGDGGPLHVVEQKTGRGIRTINAASKQYASPFVRDGTVYVAAREHTAAFDLPTGRQLWDTPTEGTRVVSTPITVGDTVFMNAGTFHAFDAATGEIRWKEGSPLGSFGVMTPVVADDMVYAGGVEVVAFDARTGERRWSFRVGQDEELFVNNRHQSLGGMSTPVLSGELLYLGSDDGHLYALNRRTGAVVWKLYIGLPIKSSPIISGNCLYVADYDGNLWCFVSTHPRRP